MLKSKTNVLIFALVVILLVGCTPPEKEMTHKEEPITDIEFSTKNVTLKKYKSYTITTDKQTIVWTTDSMKIVESDDETNKITYANDKNGRTYNAKIQLNADGIKKYSKKYADAFHRTLIIEEKE